MRFGGDGFEILERIPEAFFVLDDEWRFICLNSGAERVFFKSREKLLGKNVWEEFPEAVGSTFYQKYYKSLAEQMTVEFEEYYPPLETWFEVTAYPSEVGLVIYFRDVNECKEAEETLEALEEVGRQNELILNSAREGIISLDTKGNITLVSPAASRILGYEPDELAGRPMHETVHHSYQWANFAQFTLYR